MPYKLLLADDSVTIQRVIELTFADEDIQVSAVGDGKKAIAAIQADRPDIVLADVGMPERDGYEVASFIKTNNEFAHIPVLLLTGAFEPIDEARARAVGCDGVLVKPFEPQMVINRVKDLLAGRRPAGLWSTTPAQPAAKPASPAPVAPSTLAQAAPAGSLEDYFDRLDAAFASMEGPSAPPASAAPMGAPGSAHPSVDLDAVPHPRHAAPAPSTSFAEGIADWDPDLTGDPGRPAPIDPRPIELDPASNYVPVASARPARTGCACRAHRPGARRADQPVACTGAGRACSAHYARRQFPSRLWLRHSRPCYLPSRAVPWRRRRLLRCRMTSSKTSSTGSSFGWGIVRSGRQSRR